MAIITTSGRAAMATAIKNQTLFLAWGRGQSDWDEQLPREPRHAIGLNDEIGRRKITLAQYCQPHDDGEIIMLGARYHKVDTPSANLHVRAQFDFNDGIGETVRELGIFIGTQLQADLPDGQTYFQPQHLTDSGILLALDYIEPISRGVGARLAIDFVITF